MDDKVLKTILEHAERAAELSFECVKFLKSELEKERGLDEKSIEEKRAELKDRVWDLIVKADDEGVSTKNLQDKISTLRGSRGTAGRNLAESILKELVDEGSIKKYGPRYFFIPEEANE